MTIANEAQSRFRKMYIADLSGKVSPEQREMILQSISDLQKSPTTAIELVISTIMNRLDAMESAEKKKDEANG